MKTVILAVTLVNLAAVAFAFTRIVREKEEHLAKGQVVKLELAPVDPRSLMQGDYMRLAYKWVRELGNRFDKEERNGFVVFKLDERGVGQFVRLQTTLETLEPGHVGIRYRKRDWSVRIGAESYFFQEGTAKAYDRAKFAEMRVSPKGQTLITHLLDENLKAIEAPPREAPVRTGG